MTNDQRRRWVLIMLLLILGYATVLLGYRGRRTPDELQQAMGRVEQVSFEPQGRSRKVILQLRLEGVPYVLSGYLGPESSFPPSRQASLAQQLRTAARVFARFDVDPAASEVVIYQLTADGQELIQLRHSTLQNQIGSLVSFVLLVIFAYAGRKQLFARPMPKPLRHARRPR
ncbi:hypothetical protein [Hymenobacter sp. CRA2]|uniref:hypothetical protein n=1 Tax=Hymenobacter sp. CRA2 TaxID=1955620 RepID=UPI00098F16A0|nr:hypothetical protein [Hymenobacter sp. CRA2]OON70051.1 hypothetical protein B0919_04705 [Hymenobacter sp. CRA2]